MIRTGTDKKWFDELVLELRLQQVYGAAIGDTVASARELLADTGQSAEEAFGPARHYAASLDLPRAPQYEWMRTALWPAMIGLLAFLLFTQAAAAWAQSEPLLLSPAQLALIAAPVIAVALLPLYLAAIVRRIRAIVLLVAFGGLAGFFSSVVAPSNRAEAWLALDPVPWLVTCSLVMVALSIMNTVRARRPGSSDGIIDPLAEASAGEGRGTRVAMVVTNWLFPLFALVMLGVVSLFR
ncbi:hypothetical protein [Cryobacterium sp.]|jgi:hypothetical protein|uniref:hypothetical protein n=1 Tax=Cryobacterium sp. TaxID=1926290 RepID=UPI00260FCF5E|nr:hypothetical protein [Cryobacterium sp.]MCU1447342.1 hypothetical protein [Cryobacterium sp.]